MVELKVVQPAPEPQSNMRLRVSTKKRIWNYGRYNESADEIVTKILDDYEYLKKQELIRHGHGKRNF